MADCPAEVGGHLTHCLGIALEALPPSAKADLNHLNLNLIRRRQSLQIGTPPMKLAEYQDHLARLGFGYQLASRVDNPLDG